MKIAKYIVLLVMFTQCRERYDVPLDTPQTGYLVVEGVINSKGETGISLSRTSVLAERKLIPEAGASVVIEGDDQTVYALAEVSDGKYLSADLTLNPLVKYRLHVRTGTREYISAAQRVINTPAVDSVNWTLNGGVSIFVNTHDPANSTRYYKWEYDETWEIKSSFETNLVYDIRDSAGEKIARINYYNPVNQAFNLDIITCWQSRHSNIIHIGSTAKLTQDIITYPLLTIPKGTIQLGRLYSINVKQYALSKEGYEFYEKLKKNTEQLGTIFDAQPSEITGNVTCVSDPSELVIGFVPAAAVIQKRIFIHRNEVPNWDYSDGCLPELSLPNIKDTVLNAYGTGLLPTQTEAKAPDGSIITFKAAPNICVDCTLRGVNVKPSYWP